MNKNNKGQSLVETALILPLILLILMGIIDFGFMFNNYLVISTASREAVRAAVTGSSDTDINTIIANVTPVLEAQNMSVSISPSSAVRKKGDEVKVEVTYKYFMITPLVSTALHGPINMKAQTVMRME